MHDQGPHRRQRRARARARLEVRAVAAAYDEVLVAPGNAGTATRAACCATSPWPPSDVAGLVELGPARAGRPHHHRPRAPLRRRRGRRLRGGRLRRLSGPRRAAGAARGLQGLHQGLPRRRHGIPTAAVRHLHRRDSFDAYVGAPPAHADRGQGRRPRRRQGRGGRRDRRRGASPPSTPCSTASFGAAPARGW
jgi:hypothetical protein